MTPAEQIILVRQADNGELDLYDGTGEYKWLYVYQIETRSNRAGNFADLVVSTIQPSVENGDRKHDYFFKEVHMGSVVFHVQNIVDLDTVEKVKAWQAQPLP